MTASIDIVRAFANPYESPEKRRGYLKAACRERARSATTRFLSEIGAEVKERSDGLVDVLEEWLGAGAQLYDAMGFPFGHLERCLLTSSVDPVLSASCAALFLNLDGDGIAGAWTATYRVPSRLRLGRFATTRNGRHQVRASPERIVVCSSEDEREIALELARTTRGWKAVHGESLSVVSLGARSLPLLSRDKLDLLVPGEELDHVRPDLEGIPDEWKSAEVLLDTYAPPFLAWVADIVRTVIPLDGSGTVMRSSTHPHRFSSVAISFQCRPIQIVEALVHEASHEYLQMADRASPLEDGTDPRSYYSPLRRALRPVGSILLAFHAVGNILLLYRQCLSKSYADDGYCAACAERHTKEAAEMREALVASPALTEAGRAIVTSLAAQLGLEPPALTSERRP